MLSATGKLVVGAITDFILTAGTALLALKGFPDSWGWTVIAVGGLIASIKQVRGMAMDINK